MYLRNEIEPFLSSLSKSEHIDMADASKQNLCSFLAIQKFSMPTLHEQLVEEGFSSIKMMSPHVLYSLNKMISHLYPSMQQSENYIDRENAIYVKNQRNQALLGKSEEGPASIMVTLDKSMLEKPAIFKELLQSGMTIARINLAHDYSDWKSLVEGIRTAEKALVLDKQNRKCKIYMDLPGSKIRVGDFKNKVTLKVKEDDILRIYKSDHYLGEAENKEGPASIGLTIPEALKNVRPDDRVFFDDGNICAVVIEVNDSYLEVRIMLTRKKKAYIKPQQGVNFPDSLVHLNVPAIREKDLNILSEVMPYVDLIGISFIHQPNDIRILKRYLDQYTDKEIGIIAKIETKQALLSLSKIILEGLNLDLFGVMIARGDLAIEIGYEQLAKAQEGILQICQAAHVPVIWATSVLHQLNKKGIPSRAELTDAFMGLRADCIMMNKGPYVSSTIKFLQNFNQINKDSLLAYRSSVLSFAQYGF